MYEKNMKALQASMPALYTQLIELSKETQTTYTTGFAKNKQPIIYIGGKPLHSLENPEKEALKQIDASDILNIPFIVFFGFGSGYALYTYLRLVTRPMALCLVVEPDIYLFNEALKTTNIVPLLEDHRVIFMVGEPIDGLFPSLRKIARERNLSTFVKCIKTFTLPSLIPYQRAYYDQFAHVLREAIQEEMTSYGNSLEDGNKGIYNIHKNLGVILRSPGINQGLGILKGKPAVVVSAGPSLNKNIEVLKQHQDKVLVCALDATLEKCLRAGIKPDLVFSTERIELTTKFLDNLPDVDVSDIYLASCPVAREELYEKWKGKNLILYRPFNHFTKWIPIERGLVQCGSSSAHLAASTAEMLGCDPVILIGQDLCYSETGESHTSGLAVGTWQKGEKKQPVEKVKGNDGKWYDSTRTWISFLKQFEVAIAKSKSVYINCTEGGAKIPGALVQTLKETIEGLEPFNYTEVLEKHLKKELDKKEISKMKKCLKQTTKDLDKVLKTSRIVLNKYRKFYKQAHTYTLAELSKLSEELVKEHTQLVLMPIITDYVMHSFQSVHTRMGVDLSGLLVSTEPVRMKLFLNCSYILQWFLILFEYVSIMRKEIKLGFNSLKEL